MRKVLTVAAVALAAAALTGWAAYAADGDPKFTIGEVMDKAHKGGKDSLLRKVADGKGAKADKELLVELYTELGKNKPPKGDAKAWKTKTDALVKASKGVLADEAPAAKALVKAANCMACHNAHKPAE